MDFKGTVTYKEAKTVFTDMLGRELFFHGKAMIPYVQLPTYLRIGFWYNEKKLYSDKIIKPKVG